MKRSLIVARHEFRVTAANKAFVVMTILGPFLLLGITVLPSLLAAKSSPVAAGAVILVTGGGEPELAALAATLAPFGGKVEAAADAGAARAAAMAGGVTGWLELRPGWAEGGKPRFFSRSGTEAVLYGSLEGALRALARERRIAASGLAREAAERLFAEPSLEVVKLGKDGGESDAEDGYMGVFFTAMAFVMMLYMTTMLYGQMIGTSVVREKTSKTVEIMLSSVSTRELLFGKILGIGAAGILQYLVWIGAGLLALGLVGPALGVTAPSTLTPLNLGWLGLFFVLAFFIYAAGYAALGAAAEDEQHLGQLAWPLLLFLMVPMVLIGYLVMNPGSSFSVALSLFPLTGPVVMLVRILVSTPPAWQVILSLCLIVLTIPGMAAVAARIFRVGILMTGKRRSLAEIIRWAAEK